MESPSGSEQAREKQAHARDQQEKLDDLSPTVSLGHETVPKLGVSEGAEELILLPEGIDGQEDHGGKDPQEVKIVQVCEIHRRSMPLWLMLAVRKPLAVRY
jgi:hypothetical protein